jgi:hypothetical protein
VTLAIVVGFPAGKTLVVTSVTVAITSRTNEPVDVAAVSGTGASTCTSVISADENYISGTHVSGVISAP